MKPKLFLNSNDVSDITGQSLRTARNIMDWIRTEKRLDKRQAISIYDFCACFNLPKDVVFQYINSKDFKLLPINEDEIRKHLEQLPIDNSKTKPYLYSPDFYPLISKPRTIKPKDSDLDALSEEAG